MTTTAQANNSVDLSLRCDPLADRLTRKDRIPGPQENVVLDCTRTERLGLRGPGTIEWISAEGLTVPSAVNMSAVSPCGTVVMRLGQQEVLLTAPAGGSGKRLRELRKAWQASSLPAKGYDAYRDEGWAWFVVSGPQAPALMRRISMADLGPNRVNPNDIAQTRALHLDAVIARLDRFGAVSYDIYLDVSSAKFALDVLKETAEGLAANFELAALHPLD
jgi:sarcosine oxidase, subunit gamma